MPKIKFQSHADYYFQTDKQHVRAFLYSDYHIEPHNHQFYEMNIVLSGKGTHQIESACFHVKTGDVFMIPPMTAHAYYDTEHLDVYHVLINQKFIAQNHEESVGMPGFLQFMEIEPFLRQHCSDAVFLHLSQNQLLQLKSDLKFIQDGGDYDNDDFAPLKAHTTWKILYWLSGLLYHQLHTHTQKGVNKYHHTIIQSLEYIHQNFNEKITLETLCQNAYLSCSTFLRHFYAICGCTPMQYLNEYRCKKAREMMEHSDLSKTEIAHLCGFYDLSHMERSLKKEFQ